MTSPIEATLIPGDGIGPEIVEAIGIVLDGLGSPFVWDVRQAGVTAIQRVGDPLPPDTLESIRRTKLVLKGPLTTPIGGGFRSVNVRLREEALCRYPPVRTIIAGHRYDNIDLVLIPRKPRRPVYCLRRTRDIGGGASTREFAEAVARRL